METILKVLAALQAGTLLSIIIYGYKVITFFNNIQFKTDLMWRDYEKRVEASELGLHYHRRVSDISNDLE